jgi:hypothetical protein
MATPAPPLPLPDALMGHAWQFASLTAQSLEQDLLAKPIPVTVIPQPPSRFGIASSTVIPGVVVYGGRRALKLAQWVAAQTPSQLNFIQGEPSGLVLAGEAEMAQRWVFLTFTDAEVVQAAQAFEARKSQAQGLHFLLVQPDDSGVTYTGLFLFKQ